MNQSELEATTCNCCKAQVETLHDFYEPIIELSKRKIKVNTQSLSNSFRQSIKTSGSKKKTGAKLSSLEV